MGRSRGRFKSSISRRLWKLYQRNKHCYLCGVFLKWEQVTADHIVPKCCGGSNQINNLAVCCSECNNLKGQKVFKEGQTFEHAVKPKKVRERMGRPDYTSGLPPQ